MLSDLKKYPQSLRWGKQQAVACEIVSAHRFDELGPDHGWTLFQRAHSLGQRITARAADRAIVLFFFLLPTRLYTA
jgi:hypothetical protein